MDLRPPLPAGALPDGPDNLEVGAVPRSSWRMGRRGRRKKGRNRNCCGGGPGKRTGDWTCTSPWAPTRVRGTSAL